MLINPEACTASLRIDHHYNLQWSTPCPYTVSRWWPIWSTPCPYTLNVDYWHVCVTTSTRTRHWHALTRSSPTSSGQHLARTSSLSAPWRRIPIIKWHWRWGQGTSLHWHDMEQRRGCARLGTYADVTPFAGIKLNTASWTQFYQILFSLRFVPSSQLHVHHGHL